MPIPLTLGLTLVLGQNQTSPFDAHHFNREVRVRQQGQYLAWTPPSYKKSKAKFPLIIFLHGSGERGTDLQKVAVHGPLHEAQAGRDLPFVIVAPQCPEQTIWNPLSLTATLDDVTRRYRIDPDRIYLTGLSMGGFGTWAWASMMPERFAAIAPICGGGEEFWTGNLTGMPIWCAHGTMDNAVPFDRSKEMVEGAVRNKAQVKFTIVEGGGHNVWTAFYARPDFYDWLLKYKLSDRKAGKVAPGYVEEKLKG